LLAIAIVVSILGFGRPVAVLDLPSQQRTVILAIDVSLSMAAEDIQPNRLAAAQAAARTFTRNQPRDVLERNETEVTALFAALAGVLLVCAGVLSLVLHPVGRVGAVEHSGAPRAKHSGAD
jgi:hypothetical protein